MNEHNRHIALLKSALPYVTPESRHAMELILQADSLMTMAMDFPKKDSVNDLEATENTDQNTGSNDSKIQKADLEGLLLHIRPFCNPKEADFVQMTINFVRAEHLFRNYQSYIKTHPILQNDGTMQTEELPSSPLQLFFQLFSGIGSLSANGNGNEQILNFILAQLSPEQRDLFNKMKQEGLLNG